MFSTPLYWGKGVEDPIHYIATACMCMCTHLLTYWHNKTEGLQDDHDCTEVMVATMDHDLVQRQTKLVAICSKKKRSPFYTLLI